MKQFVIFSIDYEKYLVYNKFDQLKWGSLDMQRVLFLSLNQIIMLKNKKSCLDKWLHIVFNFCNDNDLNRLLIIPIHDNRVPDYTKAFKL